MQLLSEVKKWRVESEEDAVALIQKMKDKAGEDGYEVKKSEYTMKTKKVKGEIVEVWYVVSVTFNYDIGD